ncbi:MAG: M18 family aminopeptidase [Clostridia bacterium]|nr:M18 family aminopeptidase [Clostridia bacterium]
MEKLIDFLKNSLTAFHAVENAESLLKAEAFEKLSETEDWKLEEGGKYYLVRGGALIAFRVGSLDNFSYKIAASHTDSPALKLKENPLQKSALYATLNMETYGGGIWYSFFDRPLKLAGRVIKQAENKLLEERVTSPFTLTIPSVAIHQNRTANDGFSVNAQVDLAPLLSLASGVENMDALLKNIAGEGVISYDLFLVNADMPYSFGLNDEFLASPRIDNLSSVYASLEGLLNAQEHSGICMAACLDNEEVGSLTAQGADGDFLENVLRRIAYALRFDDNEYYKALANSFLLSVDNAHAVHPNHPEKADPTNKTVLGGGIVIKNHANKAYITDALSSALVKTIFEKAEVKCQTFFNRSDVRSGSTLGAAALRHTGMMGADIGLPQLAMHSAMESCAKSDYAEMKKGITAFYETTFTREEDGISLQ